jgi:predicted nuclease with TOPRIM domain
MDQDTKTEFSRVNDRLDNLSDRVDHLIDFLHKNMVTREELKQTIEELRAEVATKEELRVLARSVDAFVKLSKDYYQELTIMSARVNRIEEWIQRAALQVGIDYKP